MRTPLIPTRMRRAPKYFWLTSFIETALLRAIWYPTSVGPLSWLSKQIIIDALYKTSDHAEIVRWPFSARADRSWPGCWCFYAPHPWKVHNGSDLWDITGLLRKLVEHA